MRRVSVLVSGACGKVGREVVRAIHGLDDLDLAAAVDKVEVGKDIGELVLGNKAGIHVQDDLQAALSDSSPDVMVDFTTPQAVTPNALAAIEQNVRLVIGTTGIAEADLEAIRGLCETKNLGAVIAPNFAIGAVLMMHFARLAARYLPLAEIIELHHDRKVDAPSGTALKTADMIAQARSESPQPPGEHLPSRGQWQQNVPIHSVRLPGLVAHQEVIFGGLEQTLTLRHDSLGRGSFMPGVILAIRKVMELDHLVHGLELLLDL